MVNKDKITEIFVSVDDFCNIFEPELNPDYAIGIF
jgi:hypothetical protein